MPQGPPSERGSSRPRSRYVALLRAINVAGRRVKMDHLRALFVALRFHDVETFTGSGNVVFNAATRDRTTLTRRIQGHLRESFGYDVATFLRTIPELAAVAELRPFPASELGAAGNVVNVSFTVATPTKEVQRNLRALSTEIDDVRVAGREVYWVHRQGLGNSKLSGAAIERTLGRPATARCAKTIRRLVAKFG